MGPPPDRTPLDSDPDRYICPVAKTKVYVEILVIEHEQLVIVKEIR